MLWRTHSSKKGQMKLNAAYELLKCLQHNSNKNFNGMVSTQYIQLAIFKLTIVLKEVGSYSTTISESENWPENMIDR